MKLLTSFPVRVCGRRPLCQVPSAMACVSCSKDGETRSTLLSIGCSFSDSFQPPSLRLHNWLVCSTNTSWPRNCSLLAARVTRAKIHVHSRQELDSVKVCIKSNCSAVLKDDKAPEIRKHLLYLLYSHAAYPRQRASGTCMKQPSRLDIGSCTAESWYVCFPYRHLSWFAVRRSSICLLLCAACARPCQSALSPWRICKRFAQARPHSDSRMDFS